MEEEEKDEIKQLDSVKPLRLSKVFTVDSDAIVSKLYLKENVLEVVYDDWINKLKEAKVSCTIYQSNIMVTFCYKLGLWWFRGGGVGYHTQELKKSSPVA